MWVYLPIPPKEFPVGKRSIDWDFKKNGRDFESTVKAQMGGVFAQLATFLTVL